MDGGNPKNGRGGKRPGAGRPPGAPNKGIYGSKKALATLKFRVPFETPIEAAELADRALERIVSVMEGRVKADKAPAILKAATRIREEVCGPLPQKLEHAGKDGEALSVSININRTVKQ